MVDLFEKSPIEYCGVFFSSITRNWQYFSPQMSPLKEPFKRDAIDLNIISSPRVWFYFTV